MTAAWAMVLACIAGYADALVRINDGAFAANMTGNTVFLAMDAVRADWPSAVKNGLAIIAFVIGSIAARYLLRRADCRRCALAAAAGALLIAAWLHGLPQLGAVAAAMGLQDAAVMHFDGTSINTVFITGDLVNFTDAVVSPRSAQPSSRHKAFRLGGVWLSYVVGAAAGACAAPLAVRFLCDPRYALAAVLLGGIAALVPVPKARPG
ncbi:MAG TPA: YoaK family protein [Acetobacteraceae bacterium]|nr:YoaK family protein [Acetobacteraceae bacterium]